MSVSLIITYVEALTSYFYDNKNVEHRERKRWGCYVRDDCYLIPNIQGQGIY